MSRGSIWLLAGAALSVCVAGPALAESKKAAPADQPLAGPHIFMPGPGGETRVYAMRDFGGDRAERLRTLLQLRPEQDRALDAYLDALQPPRGRRNAIKSGTDTLSRLDAIERLLDEDRAAGKARLDATRTFYRQLDARQKKVFDELPHLVMAAAWTLPVPPVPPFAPPTAIMHDLVVPNLQGAFDEVFDADDDRPGV